MQPLYRLLQLNIGERVIFTLRKFWFIFFRKIIKFIFLAIVPVIVWFIIVNLVPDLLFNEKIRTLLIMAASLYELFIWLVFFYDWVDHYLDIWLVTSQEIIDVKQLGLFHRRVARQPLHSVQDVVAESKGFAQTFLHFGNVYVQSAGTKERFVFKQIAHPYQVADKINDLAKRSAQSLKK